jgi:hypothetical protein
VRDPVRITFEIAMVVALIGIGVAFLLLTGKSRIQNKNPGYGIYQETQSDTLRMNSELAPTWCARSLS